mmetsp:Transcript_11400/g.30208  ORF Transcript_11400/g.30208 Transcript_11400/m.30208 type:complete len:201 (-) Transcript_11400:2064-2666(-)
MLVEFLLFICFSIIFSFSLLSISVITPSLLPPSLEKASFCITSFSSFSLFSTSSFSFSLFLFSLSFSLSLFLHSASSFRFSSADSLKIPDAPDFDFVPNAFAAVAGPTRGRAFPPPPSSISTCFDRSRVSAYALFSSFPSSSLAFFNFFDALEAPLTSVEPPFLDLPPPPFFFFFPFFETDDAKEALCEVSEEAERPMDG